MTRLPNRFGRPTLRRRIAHTAPSRRRAALVAALTLCAAAVLVGGPATGATAHSSAQNSAMIRGGHFSPDTPGVDVYLTAFQGGTTTLWLSGVGYGDVSGYQRLAAGLYAVSMRPHGAPESTPPALSWTLDARPGAAYTACAVGMHSDLKGVVLPDDLSAPPAGHARVRVIQAASRAPQADVTVGSSTIAQGVAFGTSSNYTDVPAGSASVTATAVGKPTVTTTTHATLAPESVHTVVVLDAQTSGITARVLDDATGATTMPVGAVPAGGGATAAHAALPAWAAVAFAVLVVLMSGVTAAAATIRQRHSTRR